MIKLDILAFAAHPDDVELSCAGTLIKHVQAGKKVGIIDLTQGEMGTRGTAELRLQEAEEARKIVGAEIRENLGLKDGFFNPDGEEELMAVIRMIRKYQPEVVLANAIDDRHPDHGRGGALLKRAVFLAGLRRIETVENGVSQEPWRPGKLYHYIQFRYRVPDFVVDISEYFETRQKAVLAFKSQFYDPSSDEPKTLISSENFMKQIEARAREMGSIIGAEYAEGFESAVPVEMGLLV